MDLNPVSQAVRSGLANVDRLIARYLSVDDPFLCRLAGYMTSANGKRVRPALVLLTARHLGRVSRRTLTLAAAVEMLHAATLVHDDILDNAPMRRHQKTLNFRWGNEMSVLMGDFVFAASFRLMTQDLPRQTLCIITKSAATVCQGQIRETLHRYDTRIDEAGYIRIIGEKTASLLATCCEASALEAGTHPSTVDAFRRFGYLLGLAFQIIDDTLDYAGQSSRIGKPVLSDLKEGRITLPLIHCMERASAAERRRLRSVVEKARRGAFDPAPVLKLLARHGSIEYTRMRARDYAAKAQTVLLRAQRSRRPDELLAYSEYLVRRDH